MDKLHLIRWGLNLMEMIAFVSGLLHWRKLRHTYWKWFVVYLGLIVCVELTGKYIWLVLENTTLNAQFYLYFGIPVQFFFFCWLFGRYFATTRRQVLAYTCAAIYAIAWIIDIFYFSQSKWWFSSFSYTIGNILLLVLIFSYFSQVIRSDRILGYKGSLMFWVCLGLLVFYLGTLPFYGLRNTLFERHPSIFMAYWYVQFVLDYLMYLFFTLGFIWYNRK